jgi:hypothetical protein
MTFRTNNNMNGFGPTAAHIITYVIIVAAFSAAFVPIGTAQTTGSPATNAGCAFSTWMCNQVDTNLRSTTCTTATAGKRPAPHLPIQTIRPGTQNITEPRLTVPSGMQSFEWRNA